MKCSKCHQVIADSKGIVLTFVGGYTYTAVLHRWCCDATIGPANTRKLVQTAIDSGWVQHELPGFSPGNSPVDTKQRG